MVVEMIIMCPNENCENYNNVINSFIADFSDNEEYEAFLESYGFGSEEDDDICKICNHLGHIIEMKELV